MDVRHGCRNHFRSLQAPQPQAVPMADSSKGQGALFEAAVRSLPDVLLVVDRSGTIRQAWGATDEVLGYRPGDLLDLEIERLVPRVARERHRTLREGYLAEPRVRPMGQGGTLEAVRKDGSIIPVEVKLAAVEPTVAGEEGLVSVVVRDVSQRVEEETLRRRTEEELRRLQRGEALTRFHQGMVHDLSNLLTVIGGHAELIALDPDSGSISTHLDAIGDAVAHGSTLLRHLLDFGSGRHDAVRPTDLTAALRELGEVMSRLLPDDISLRMDLEPDSFPVPAARPEIAQILLNLVLNARDAIAGSGRIWVVTRRDTLEARRDGLRRPAVRLTVRDTGVGMSPEVRERALEPFFTTKSDQTGAAGGSGLGLPLIRSLVESLGGRIAIESRPGEGTSVHVVLPLPANRAVREDVATAVSSRRRVLVLDRDKKVREIARLALTRRGIEVTAAAPGDLTEVRQAEDGGGWDLVILDRSHAKALDALLDRVRAAYPRTRILVTSSESDLHQMLEHVPTLPKPFTPAGLVEKVLSLLAG